MTTSRPSTRPRSLADDLRARDHEGLAALLTARPDLIHPMPADLAALAARAATTASVSAALDGLNQLHLLVCEALAALPDPATLTQLHSGLAGSTGYRKRDVDSAVARLREVGLIWGHSLHLVRAAREAFGSYPCGLGPSMAESRTLVREYDHNPERVRQLIDSAPAGVAEIVGDLMWTPHGSLPDAARRLDPSKVRSPLEWMLVHDIIVAVADNSVVMPREVSLALRNGRLLSELPNDPVSLATGHCDVDHVNAQAAVSALEVLRMVEGLLEEWSSAPPTAPRGGGLAARDLTAAAGALHCDEATTALIAEVAFAANLIAIDDAGQWVPTTNYDKWLTRADAQRWVELAAAWQDMPRSSHTATIERPLAATTERGWLAPLRQGVIAALAEQPMGTTTDAQRLTTYLDWQRPRRASHARDAAVAAIVREAATLGLTGAGALASFALAVFRGDADPAALLAQHIPAAVDHIIVQADLTALAPGRLLPEPARLMGLLADVESTGVATSYRITEGSIRRALDHGHSAAELLDFLSKLSRTALPQPLTYLVADVARKHGALRVGVASVFLRSDDADLLQQVTVDRKLAALRFRVLAPGVVVSPSPADVVLERLRQAGYAPMAESADGTLIVQRAQPRRTSSHATSAQVTTLTPSPRLIAAAVQALLTADVTPAVTGGASPRLATSTTVALLREAVATGRPLWIGYADKSGMAKEYTVEPLTLTAGFLTAFDAGSSEVRTYTISRITGAQYADTEGDRRRD